MANCKFRVLAIDPGLTNFGYSLIEGDIRSRDLVVLKTGEIHPGPTVDKKNYREEVERYDKRTVSLAYLREQVSKLILQLKPDAIASEDIFINMHRPQAYGALCMVICTLKLICRDVANKPLVTIPTKICKQVLARGDFNKDDVQRAILANPHLKFKDENERLHLSEHVADSIAVALALFDRYHNVIEAEVERRNGK